MGSGMLKECKCINCTRRDIGCHSRCEDYKKWKTEVDKVRKAMRKLRRKKQYTYK